MTSTPATTAIVTAVIAGLLALAKKLLPRKQKPCPDYITRAEFQTAVDSLRDRMDTLADKIEQHHTSLLTAIDRQGTNFEHRLDSLDAAVARLDERTKSF